MLNTYDGLLIFNPALSDDALDKALGRLRAEITRLEGRSESTENLGKRSFARPRKRMDGGLYVRLRFALSPLKVDAFKKRCKLVDDLFRLQVRAFDPNIEARLDRQTERRKAHAAAIAEGGAAGRNQDS